MNHNFSRSDIKISMSNYILNLKNMLISMEVFHNKVADTPRKGFFSKVNKDRERAETVINDIIVSTMDHIDDLENTIKTIDKSSMDEADFFPLTDSELKIVREFMETGEFRIENDVSSITKEISRLG